MGNLKVGVSMQSNNQVIQKSNIDYDFHIFRTIDSLVNKEVINIMTIDDNKKDSELFEELLSVEGNLKFSFSKWTNPSEAIYELKNTNFLPDLIILDLIMPGINGKIVLDYLESINKEIPVIVYSSMNNYENIKRVQLYHQVLAFFSKPVNVKEFESFCLAKLEESSN